MRPTGQLPNPLTEQRATPSSVANRICSRLGSEGRGGPPPVARGRGAPRLRKPRPTNRMAWQLVLRAGSIAAAVAAAAAAAAAAAPQSDLQSPHIVGPVGPGCGAAQHRRESNWRKKRARSGQHAKVLGQSGDHSLQLPAGLRLPCCVWSRQPHRAATCLLHHSAGPPAPLAALLAASTAPAADCAAMRLASRVVALLCARRRLRAATLACCACAAAWEAAWASPAVFALTVPMRSQCPCCCWSRRCHRCCLLRCCCCWQQS